MGRRAIAWAGGLGLVLGSLLLAADPDPGVGRIGPQDRVEVAVWDHPDLSGTLTVTQDGSIAFPLLGAVPAAGKTVTELEQELERRLNAHYLVSPHVRVTRVEVKSQQIFILGEVKNPGAYPLTRETTLLEALTLAGDFTPDADPQKIELFRQGLGPENHLAFTLEELLSRTDGRDPLLLLKPGDVVFKPRAEFFFVFGQVNKPGRYVLEPGITVLKAIALAGGFAPKASRNRATLLRRVEGVDQRLPAKFSDPVLAQDVIQVPEGLF
jgi:polysaccharide export outer membrane protein